MKIKKITFFEEIKDVTNDTLTLMLKMIRVILI